jgi:hypothetical protein
MTAGEQGQVRGDTPSPSIDISTTYGPTQVAEVVAQARNAAQIVVTNSRVASVTYGTVAGPQYIVYREGDMRITGNSTGAGLLVVNGDLEIVGTMRWYGVVIVTGNFRCGAGTAQIHGATVIGEQGGDFDLRGTADLRFSREAIDLAVRLTGRYVAFNGWQEIGLGEAP